jgi:hypothetical protein
VVQAPVVDRAVPPFFVVGNPRSGTKMLRELLNASPDLWMSEVESHFIPRFARRIGRYGDLSSLRRFTRLADQVRRTRAFWQWQRRGVLIGTEEWFNACSRYDWPGIVEGLYHCVYERESPNAPTPWRHLVWGDKTPHYMGEIPTLASLFPQSRFIHIVRDPRDCVLSTESAWGNSPERTAHEWAERVRRCRPAGRALGEQRFLELRYEDLVADVPGQLGRLFDFLGVATPPDAGRLHRVPENLGAAKGAREVVAGNTGKWKSRMPPEQRRAIEALTGDMLDAYGYEREHPALPTESLSPARMAAYRVRDAWQQLRFRRRELGSWSEVMRFLMAR